MPLRILSIITTFGLDQSVGVDLDHVRLPQLGGELASTRLLCLPGQRLFGPLYCGVVGAVTAIRTWYGCGGATLDRGGLGAIAGDPAG